MTSPRSSHDDDLEDQLLDSRDQWLLPLQYPVVSSISPGVALGGRRGSAPAKKIAKAMRHFQRFFLRKARALGLESVQGRRAAPRFGDRNGQDGDEEEKKLPQIAQPESNPLPDTFTAPFKLSVQTS